MKRPDLNGIRKRVEAASPGPWRYCGAESKVQVGGCSCGTIWSIPHDHPVLKAIIGEWGDCEAERGTKGFLPYGSVNEALGKANARFAANARQDLPELLAYAEELEANLAEANKQNLDLEAKWLMTRDSLESAEAEIEAAKKPSPFTTPGPRRQNDYRR